MRRLALPVLLALAACGQKGNLYLPDEGVQTVPVSTGAAGATIEVVPATPVPAADDSEADKPDAKRR
jgi:predicted small lipoprotein YifL